MKALFYILGRRTICIALNPDIQNSGAVHRPQAETLLHDNNDTHPNHYTCGKVDCDLPVDAREFGHVVQFADRCHVLLGGIAAPDT